MRTEQWEEGYEVGHEEGERCRSADWALMLDDLVPESVDEWEANQVVPWIAKLRAIVEALAEAGPPVDRHDGDCQLCDAEGGLHTDLYKPEQHEPDCPWRMAKEALT